MRENVTIKVQIDNLLMHHSTFSFRYRRQAIRNILISLCLVDIFFVAAIVLMVLELIRVIAIIVGLLLSDFRSVFSAYRFGLRQFALKNNLFVVSFCTITKRVKIEKCVQGLRCVIVSNSNNIGWWQASFIFCQLKLNDHNKCVCLIW